MKPKIDKTKFGSVTIAGEKYEHDIVIRMDGKVEKRKKKLSKEIYGTSHMISLAEAEHVYEAGADRIIIGSGQTGMVTLSPEADAFSTKKMLSGCCPHPAIHRWNEAKATIGLFHVTC
jgi:hypothetical protein